MPVDVAWRTRQFWLLWAVLCLNVSAGIGILGMASPMIQEMFKGRVTASAAAGFAGLLSLFNIGGRIFWASLSDRIGRKHHLHGLLRARHACSTRACRSPARRGSLALFVAIFCVILTMYGGGFATIPAYLADLFGVGHVSAIHGRLLTAWSTAGILGPVLVNYIREFQIGARRAAGRTPTRSRCTCWPACSSSGFVCNLATRPVPDRLFGAPVAAQPCLLEYRARGRIDGDARSGGAVADRRRRVGARRDAARVGSAEDTHARQPDVPVRV